MLRAYGYNRVSENSSPSSSSYFFPHTHHALDFGGSNGNVAPMLSTQESLFSSLWPVMSLYISSWALQNEVSLPKVKSSLTVSISIST